MGRTYTIPDFFHISFLYRLESFLSILRIGCGLALSLSGKYSSAKRISIPSIEIMYLRNHDLSIVCKSSKLVDFSA